MQEVRSWIWRDWAWCKNKDRSFSWVSSVNCFEGSEPVVIQHCCFEGIAPVSDAFVKNYQKTNVSPLGRLKLCKELQLWKWPCEMWEQPQYPWHCDVKRYNWCRQEIRSISDMMEMLTVSLVSTLMGYTMVIAAFIVICPQIVTVFREQRVDGLTLPSLIFDLIGNRHMPSNVWVNYGIPFYDSTD